jgi:hypothetical protein
MVPGSANMEAFLYTESLLPFRIAELQSLESRLLSVSTADLQSFVAVRKDGSRADSMLATLYGARLGSWHREAGRLADDTAELFYDAGQLYGIQLCEDRYWADHEAPLPADDADAYAVAKSHVLTTYDNFDLPPDTPRWEREKRRELAFTGSDLLSILNASLYPHTRAQLQELYDMDEVPSDSALAFYTGLLDAVIFTDAYLRFRKSLAPQVFPVALSYASPAGAAETHLTVDVDQSAGDVFGTTAFEVGKGAGQVAVGDYADGYNNGAEILEVTLGGQRYQMEVVPIQVQTGPGSFSLGYDVISARPIEVIASPRGALRIGGLAVAGAVGANVLNLALQAAEGAGTSSENATVLGTIIGLGVGLLSWARRRTSV